MLEIVKRIYHRFLRYKYKMYLDSLVRRGLKIGKNVAIIESVFFDPTHCFLISIGDNCTLAPNVRLIAHDASMKQSLGYTKVGKIIIEDNCFIGDSVIVLNGVTIGEGSVVGAGAVVIEDIPKGSVAAGNPCRVICHRKEWEKRHEQCVNSRLTQFAELEQGALSNSQKDEICKSLNLEPGYVR